ncbi:MAG: hypothetical protein ACI9TB_003006, partial [Parasphingorhabdus sp.]
NITDSEEPPAQQHGALRPSLAGDPAMARKVQNRSKL